MSINSVHITGNLTRDPDIKATRSGSTVMNLGVAVNDRRRNQQSGEWEDYPNYIDCVMFGKRAQAVSQYLNKGSKVSIEGKLHWSSWQDKDTGKNRSKIEVYVNEIEFVSSNHQPQQYQQPNYQPAPQRYQQPAQAPVYQQAPLPPQQPVQQQEVYEDIPF